MWLSSVYPVAVLLALVLAVWLQRSEPLPRLHAWLSWGGAAVFALLLAPVVWRQPTIQTASQALLIAALPLIAVPYQVRMMRLINGARKARDARAGPERARGPGGGRVRSRGRRR